VCGKLHGGGSRLLFYLKFKLRYGTSRNEQNFLLEFYVYGSVQRRSILIIVQRDATQSSQFIILQVHSTCFGCQPHSSSLGVQRTVTTASGTVQLPPSNVTKLAWLRWREVAAQKIWPVPEAVVTVLCTPDDGCGWQPKHVEWTCRIINRLLCVASRWTTINIHKEAIYCFCPAQDKKAISPRNKTNSFSCFCEFSGSFFLCNVC